MIKNIEELNDLTATLRAQNGFKDPLAWAIGRVSRADSGESIAVDYAVVNFKENLGSAAVLINACAKSGENVDFSASEAVLRLNSVATAEALSALGFLENEAKGDKHKNLQSLLAIKEAMDSGDGDFVMTILFSDDAPKSVEAVYLKLYLLSLGRCELRSVNLNGAFGLLPNLAWDYENRPYTLDYLRANEIKLKMSGKYPNIAFVDKFPRFLSHIIPADNTRILDSAKVRMGAQLAAGTTVMPGASYINFNSGTTGSVMVEGRISSSVKVGEGSDVGGGASILGVLSGTNGNPISVGKRCLLGANSVTGIPLGDDCIVDAGLAILEGTKIFIGESDRAKLNELNSVATLNKDIYKALELSGLNGLHFRQNSQTGQIIASISKRAIKLNKELH